ncbi:type II toxin-antitoxin system prevent-host-death family antitoxin [Gordonibacter sp. 28C]|uniref:type II toxin-antitoxin system Phd/YefM family antitoxin n=1 Tax=Gordonibacter sp. 28C TaxID=2078569 RepID=UPI000DF7B916|nr:type II toxin-antitoxin system prevent-host-death family antitoxin [Gordonibacter sp. 28C]RDB63363.1 type II toxin-antitoxin system prevent-host-death family antitoxin [Gordonibacter sp. 28C]
MMVTATELKSNLGHYLDAAQHEDVLISKNGRTIAKLTSPYAERSDAMKSLFGILPPTASVDEARAIRAEEKWALS